jgi:Icc-related predicted phosphoesterase
MKILIASDLHYSLRQYDWLAARARSFDALIIAGDLLDISSPLDLNLQISVVGKYLQKISEQTTLLVCSGNHDGNEKNTADEFVAPWLQDLRAHQLHVDGDDVRFGNTLITIFPWWDGDVTRQQVAEQIEKASKLECKQWIWMYHSPPDNSPTSWVGSRFMGDGELNKWIAQYRPDLVISGHIHESPFKKGGSWADRIGSTWVLNAGNNVGDMPAHIVLDLDPLNHYATIAQWVSIEGVETLTLSKAVQ